jgi:hypothetical protein
MMNEQVHNEQIQGLSEKALANLDNTEDEIEQSTAYFKPRENKDYLLMINPEDKIEPRLNERFKDANGRPVIRYEFKITHVNSGKRQLWETSKTLVNQITPVLRKGFKVLHIQRFGTDRSTVYKVEGVE